MDDKGYNFHTSKEIRDITKRSTPKRGIVGLKITLLCVALTLVAYMVAKSINTGEQIAVAVISTEAFVITPVGAILILAGAVLLLCVLLSVVIGLLRKNRKD